MLWNWVVYCGVLAEARPKWVYVNIWGETYGVVNARAADCCNWDAAWLRAIPGPAVVVEMGGRDEGTGRGTASDWAR